MARINIEDSIFKDGRFIDLCIALGDKQKALGALVWAFIIAQKFYLDESSDRLIPLSEWKRQSCENKLLDFGFAEMRDKGVYVCGSEKQFAWLVQRVEAGRKGGNSTQIKRQEMVAVAKRDEAVEQPPSLSLPLSLSPSSFEGVPKSKKRLDDTGKPDRDPEDSRVAWESYAEAFRERWKTEPLRNARVNSQMRQFLKRVPSDEAPEIIRFYVFHNRAFYVEKQHPIGLLLQDAESIRTQWATQRQVTRRDAQTVENKQSVYNAFAGLLMEMEAANGK